MAKRKRSTNIPGKVRMKKDGMPAKKPGRKAASTTRGGLMSKDLYKVLQDMVNKAVAELQPSKIIEAKKAPATGLQKLIGSKVPRNAAQAKLFYQTTRSPMDIPNPAPDRHYYWVSTNAFDQQRMMLEGYTFVVGEDEIRTLGYDPQIFMNNRHRCYYLDVELAWQPKDLAVMRRKVMREKTRDKIEQTSEAFKRVAEGVGGEVIETLRVGTQTVTRKGAIFDHADD